VKQAEYQPLAQLEFQRFHQPPLCDVEGDQKPGDQEEDAQLEEKIPQVAARQSVVERFVPPVQANLPVGGGGDDYHDGGQHEDHRLLHAGAEDGAHHQADLAPKAQVGRLTLGRSAGDFCRAFCHRAPHSATL